MTGDTPTHSRGQLLLLTAIVIAVFVIGMATFINTADTTQLQQADGTDDEYQTLTSQLQTTEQTVSQLIDLSNTQSNPEHYFTTNVDQAITTQPGQQATQQSITVESTTTGTQLAQRSSTTLPPTVIDEASAVRSLTIQPTDVDGQASIDITYTNGDTASIELTPTSIQGCPIDITDEPRIGLTTGTYEPADADRDNVMQACDQLPDRTDIETLSIDGEIDAAITGVVAGDSATVDQTITTNSDAIYSVSATITVETVTSNLTVEREIIPEQQ